MLFGFSSFCSPEGQNNSVCSWDTVCSAAVLSLLCLKRFHPSPLLLGTPSASEPGKPNLVIICSGCCVGEPGKTNLAIICLGFCVGERGKPNLVIIRLGACVGEPGKTNSVIRNAFGLSITRAGTTRAIMAFPLFGVDWARSFPGKALVFVSGRRQVSVVALWIHMHDGRGSRSIDFLSDRCRMAFATNSTVTYPEGGQCRSELKVWTRAGTVLPKYGPTATGPVKMDFAAMGFEGVRAVKLQAWKPIQLDAAAVGAGDTEGIRDVLTHCIAE